MPMPDAPGSRTVTAAGDLSLQHWRDAHERFFSDTASPEQGFVADMPVVCERFRVLYSD